MARSSSVPDGASRARRAAPIRRRDGVRVGVIGSGEISEYHLGGLAAVEDVEVVVIAARTAKRAAVRARRFGIAEVADDWRRVVDRPDLDAVVIATPDETHPEIVAAAIESRKAILVQKPIATSLDAARPLVAQARAANVLLSVSFMHRHFEEVVALRDLLIGGVLGRPLTARIRNATSGPLWSPWFYHRPATGTGGVVIQLGVHGIDLLAHLLGPIRSVTARAETLAPERRLADGSHVAVEVVDHALASYEFASGALASHEMSWAEVAGTDRFRLEVYGTDGTAWVRWPTDGLAVHTEGPGGMRGWFRPDLAPEPPGARHHRAWIAQIRGDEPPDGTDLDALAGLDVIEAVHRAATGRCEVAARSRDELLAP
ncbi:MAG: Gfo/Idh/MocA family oxidoreductase [Chloroflexota bacterium]